MANKLRNALVPPGGACRPDELIASDIPAESTINQHPLVTHLAWGSVTVIIIMIIVFMPKPRQSGVGESGSGAKRLFLQIFLVVVIVIYQSTSAPSNPSRIHRLTSPVTTINSTQPGVGTLVAAAAVVLNRIHSSSGYVIKPFINNINILIFNI